MYHNTLKWYRSLSRIEKCFAWVVVAAVAVVSVAVVAIPWVLSSRLRDKVKILQADAAVTKAKQQISFAKKKTDALEGIRDKALKVEAANSVKVDELHVELDAVDQKLKNEKAKIGGQTDEEQGQFFDTNFNGD